MSMLTPYHGLLDRCEPFLIAGSDIAPLLDREPLGVRIPDRNVFHPQQRKNADFLTMLRLVDQLTFGPFGMQMPSWVFYDCAVMPGAVFGLGIRADRLEDWAREAMQVPATYDGLVPVSQFIAIPMLAGFAGGAPTPRSWLLYTLESLNLVSPGIAPAGALRATMALGLRVFPIDELHGTTQWRSPRLVPYSDLGPLELVTAYTPAHSLPRTLSFRLRMADASIEQLLAAEPRSAPHANLVLEVDDVAALKAVQRDIEAGCRIHVAGHPVVRGSSVRVPLFRQPPDAAPAD
jgi:hypothetical protein